MVFINILASTAISVLSMVSTVYAQQATMTTVVPYPLSRPFVYNSSTITSAKTIVENDNTNGITGYILLDRQTGKVLDALNSESLFIPASVTKIFTAKYALDVLRPQYKFETRLLSNGIITNGVLNGDLILQGGGDPELDLASLVKMVEALENAGIHAVTGQFLYDGNVLPSLSEIELNQPLMAAYNPSISGLNLNFNRVYVNWNQLENKEYDIRATSRSDGYEYVTDYTRTKYILDDSGTTKDVVFSIDDDKKESWIFSSSILKTKGTRWLPVKNSALYTANIFRNIAFEKAGIQLAMPRIGTAPVLANTITVHVSRPVEEIVNDMLRYSTNLTAEALGLSSSIARGKNIKNLVQSASEMVRYTSPEFAKKSLVLKNHSGLSSTSRVTPRVTAALLKANDLSKNLKDFSIKGLHEDISIVAKTGTIYYGRGLAGYIIMPDNRELVFAIFTSDFEARKTFERLFDPSSTITYSIERTWLSRARKLEKSILSFWADKYISTNQNTRL